jgi:hypothetical protein
MMASQMTAVAVPFLMPFALVGGASGTQGTFTSLPTMSAVADRVVVAVPAGDRGLPLWVRNPEKQRPLPERVSMLRDSSGLSAQQLARLFGVSRRSINHWLSGKPMADEHATRLGRLETAVAQLPAGTGIERRRALLAGDGGPSLYQKLCAEVRSPDPLQGVGLTVDEQVR